LTVWHSTPLALMLSIWFNTPGPVWSSITGINRRLRG